MTLGLSVFSCRIYPIYVIHTQHPAMECASRPKNNTEFVFIHVSKTGGETLITLLGLRKDHGTAYERLCDQKQQMRLQRVPSANAWKFAVVRNPYSRLVSWYFHLRRHLLPAEHVARNTTSLGKKAPCFQLCEKNGVKMNPAEHRFLAERLPFREWAFAILMQPDLYRLPVWGPCGTQTEMLCHPVSGDLLVDDVYRYEDGYAEVVLPDILRRLGRADLVPQIQVTNSSVDTRTGSLSRRLHYSAYYEGDRVLIAQVARHFRTDLERFGYAFEFGTEVETRR